MAVRLVRGAGRRPGSVAAGLVTAALLTCGGLAGCGGSGPAAAGSPATASPTSHTPPAAAPPAATTPASPASPAGAPVALSGEFRVVFDDNVAAVACPGSAPPGAGCFLLTATTATARFGTVSLGPTLDLEVPAGTPQCRAAATYPTRLTTPRGVLRILERGPRLCVGVVGTVPRSFRVTGGTGRYVAASGGGTVAMAVQQVGAVETWTGRIRLTPG